MSKSFNLNNNGFTFLPQQKGKPFVKRVLAKAKTNSGFTLIELLISIAIIAILTTVGIASFNNAKIRNDLKNQAKEIVSQMRKIRTDSVAASKPTACISPVGDPDPKIFYGTYISFTLSGTSYTSGISCFTQSGNAVVTPTNTVNFTNGITTSAISARGGTVYFNFNGDVYVMFTPPGNQADAQDLGVAHLTGSKPESFKLTQGAEDYYIYFNGAGLVCTQKTAPFGTCAF